ncbi:MAG: sulfatase modifying factor 1 [Myxococcota bacterium]|jgi:sulfatase modifying factor 1
MTRAITWGGVALALSVFGCGGEPPRTVLWGADMSRAEEAGAVRLEPGVFLMGSPKGEKGRYPSEQLHEVKLTRGFWILESEVTQGLYQEVMGTNPSSNSECGPTCPVEEVNWYDAIAFCNRLSKFEGLQPPYIVRGQQVTWNWGANGYRLPTEAEWEYAARSGGRNRGPLPGGGPAADVAWHSANARGSTHPVKQKRATELGLYDVGGNVREWVWDYPMSFGTGYAIDPTGPTTGTQRLTRGGGWTADPRRVRNAYRKLSAPTERTPHVGFRIARTAADSPAP